MKSINHINHWFWRHGDLSYGYEVQMLVCIAVVLVIMPFLGLIHSLTK